MSSPHTFYNSDEEDEHYPRIFVKDLNDHITCLICYGYLVDATVLGECYHCFCRSCILKHFMTKSNCPVPGCNKVILHNIDPYKNLKSDRQLQELINKVVPNLLADEQKRKASFYRSKGLPIPEDLHEEEQSGETAVEQPNEPIISNSEFVDQVSVELVPINDETSRIKGNFLRCPTLATIWQLQKFVKYVLKDQSIVVDFFYNNEILGKHHTLKFILLTRYTRLKNDPLRLHYQIDNRSSITSKRVDEVASPLVT